VGTVGGFVGFRMPVLESIEDLAAQTAGRPRGGWRIANSPALAIALPNAYFAQLGLPPMVVRPA
jgi:hypothetical protein